MNAVIRMLGEQSTSRRRFLQGSGGLLLGFALPGFGAEQSRNQKPPEAAVGHATSAVTQESSGLEPNAFIRIDRAGVVTLIIHKVEMGQGTFTSLPMLLAEELEVDLNRVKLEQAPADNTRYSDPLLGGQVTGGSTSIRATWKPLRQAGATARTLLVSAAAQQWKVDPSSCVARNGVVTHQASNRSLNYGQLVDAAARLPVPKEVALKPPKDFTLIGKAHKRLDSPDKVDGKAQFGIDVRLPNMSVAAVAISPVLGGKLQSADDKKAMAIKGVRQVVKLDRAVAVLGDHMWAAKQGLAALSPAWNEGSNASMTTESLVAGLRATSEKQGAVARNDGQATQVIGKAPRKIEAIYEMPYLLIRINEAPTIEVYMVKSSDAPGGIGEPGCSAIAPALTNAIFAATGKRLRKLPVTATSLKT